MDWTKLREEVEEWERNNPEPACDCNGKEEYMPGQPGDKIKWHLLECAWSKHRAASPGHASHYKCVQCGKQATEWHPQGYGCGDCLESY